MATCLTHVGLHCTCGIKMPDPKPPAKRKAKFKRWTAEEYGGCFVRLKFDGKSVDDYHRLARALNDARVALTTGRKARKP